MKSNLVQWFEKNQLAIIRLLIIVTFFALPFTIGRIAELSGVPVPKLKVTVVPPGYPIEGTPWSIKVWGSFDNGQTWTPVKNATIEINTTNQGDFVLYSDDQGTAAFTYVKEYGTTTIVVISEEYGSSEWVPQTSFVSSDVALIVISAFGICTPSAVWQILSKSNRKDVIDKILFYVLLVSSVMGFFTSFLWFYQWNFGSEWGFGNRITTLLYPLDFYPHLIVIASVALISGFLSSLKLLFERRRALERKKKLRMWFESLVLYLAQEQSLHVIPIT
jgi:hypothetical protein